MYRSGPNPHVALNRNSLPVGSFVPRSREGMWMAKLTFLSLAFVELFFADDRKLVRGLKRASRRLMAFVADGSGSFRAP